MEMEKSLIGAVITTRNDNYGLTLNERATYCINSSIDTYDVVYLIDWNSDKDKGPLLWDIKNNINFRGNLKHIVVEPEIAKILTGNDPNAQVCCEVLARNIGIRRLLKECDWIMSTNIDIIAPKREDIINLLKTLDPKTFYSISRRPAELENIRKFNSWKDAREYLYNNSEERHWDERVTSDDDYSLHNCAGDAQLATKEIWQEIRGFEEDLIYVLYSDTNVQKKAVKHGFGLKALYQPPVFHINHGKGGGGFLDGINKKVNDMYRAITGQEKTENEDSWGFSGIEIEYELL